MYRFKVLFVRYIPNKGWRKFSAGFIAMDAASVIDNFYKCVPRRCRKLICNVKNVGPSLSIPPAINIDLSDLPF